MDEGKGVSELLPAGLEDGALGRRQEFGHGQPGSAIGRAASREAPAPNNPPTAKASPSPAGTARLPPREQGVEGGMKRVRGGGRALPVGSASLPLSRDARCSLTLHGGLSLGSTPPLCLGGSRAPSPFGRRGRSRRKAIRADVAKQKCGLAHAGHSPIHAYPGVSPIDYKGTYFRVDMHRKPWNPLQRCLPQAWTSVGFPRPQKRSPTRPSRPLGLTQGLVLGGVDRSFHLSRLHFSLHPVAVDTAGECLSSRKVWQSQGQWSNLYFK